MEALQLIEQADEAKADLIEVRLDSLDRHDRLADFASHGKTPKIATNKLLCNNGNFKGTVSEQKQILLTAAKSGFNYVDIELSTKDLEQFTAQISNLGCKPIVSFHNHEGTMEPTELLSVLENEIASGASICKIVPTAKRIEDNLPLLDFCREASKKTNLVCFAMGEQGRVSRLLSPLFGCSFTFASLERGNETASGQMTIGEMRTAYKLIGV